MLVGAWRPERSDAPTWSERSRPQVMKSAHGGVGGYKTSHQDGVIVVTARASRVSSLAVKKADFVMAQPEFAETVREVIEAVRNGITSTSTEADVVHHFELNTSNLLKETLGVEYSPLKESPVKHTQMTANGRIDSRIGNVLVEFKRPAKLLSNAHIAAAKRQLQTYLESLQLEDEQIAVGYLTDGLSMLRMEIDSTAVTRVGALEPLSTSSYTPLIRDLLALDRTRLTPRSLVESFAPSDGPLFSLARVLFKLLRNDSLGRTNMLFDEWQLLFKLAHEDQSKQKAIEDRRTALATALGVSISRGDNEAEYGALFAIQTAYAVVLKLIASHLLNGVRDGAARTSFDTLIESSSDVTQNFMARLEDGAIFRDEGFENLLEGDFFSWYSDSRQWTDEVHVELVEILRILAKYENTAALERLGESAMDLFKDLYMAVIPEKVRHNLGEFYTPPWLADHTLTTAIASRPAAAAQDSWRGLDPCCGSGTFLTSMIRHVLVEEAGSSRQEQLDAVLNRVVGIDLNPLAVLTARINYFTNVAHLIAPDSTFEIPVYLGDASKLPSLSDVDEVPCVSYTIRTIKGDLDITLPASMISDTDEFSKAMTEAEILTKLQKPAQIATRLESLCAPRDLTSEVRQHISSFADALVELERQEWNGIWPRIVANFLTTASLGKFDVIVGNPPWIDWKNLPQQYRNSLVEICVDRRLFSGAGRTGGINLNICALITHVAAHAWLDPKGILAFLMPEPLIFQKSYEGFRRFEDITGTSQHYIQTLVDWTEAGNPFHPVTQPFLTYVIGSTPSDYVGGVPVSRPKRKKLQRPLRDFGSVSTFSEISDQFDMQELVAARPSSASSALAYCDDADQAKKFRTLAGKTDYRGRDGLQLYPEDLYLFSFNGKLRNTSGLKNASFLSFEKASNRNRPQRTEHILETRYMRPVVKGTEIERFNWTGPSYYAPLPYDTSFGSGRTPLPPEELGITSPRLLRYFVSQEQRFSNQSSYNERIVGERHHTEFYTFTRVGAYTHASVYVAFRHNTKWAAAVVEPVISPWGDEVLPVFQSHALSICEGPNGRFISTEEAHYLCAVLNAPIVQKFIYQSSDVRSFKVQPQLNIPHFDARNEIHQALSAASVRAHASSGNEAVLRAVDDAIDNLVSELVSST